MTWGSPTFVQSGQNKTSGTTLVITHPAVTTAAGNVLIAVIASDNTGTTDGDLGDITGVTDSRGNTYTKALQFTNGQGAAAAGATVAIFYSVLGVDLVSGDTITTTWATATVAKAVSLHKHTFGAGSTVSVQTSGTEAADAADVGAITLTPPSAEYFFLRGIAHEGVSTDGITPTALYGLIGGDGTSGGGGASNIQERAEGRIATSSSETSNPTYVAADHASVFVALKENPAATLTTGELVAAHPTYNGNWYVIQVDNDTPEIDGFWGGIIADSSTTLGTSWFPGLPAQTQDPEMLSTFDTSDAYAHGDHDPEDPWWSNTYGFPSTNGDYLAYLFPPVIAEPDTTFAAQPTLTEHPHELWYPAEQTSEDLHNPTVFDATTVVADVPVSGSDSLAVALTDSGSVQKLEAIEGLVAAGYSTFQGDVEPLESPQLSTEDYHQSALDLAWFLTTEPKSASDTLAVAITDTASAQAFEGIEQIVAAQPSEYGRLEAETEPQAEIDLHHTSTLEVSWMSIFASVQGEPIETFAAQPHFGEAFWEDTPTDDYTPHTALDTAFIVADVPVPAADNLGIALTDTASVQAFDSVEQLVGSLPVEPYPVDSYIPFEQTVEDWGQVTSLDVSALTPSTPLAPDEILAAAYTTFENQVEQLEQPQTTIEDYGAPSLEVTAQFGNVELSASDTLGIALTDTASVAVIEGIEQLVGAQPQLGDIPDVLIPVDDHPGNWEAISALDVAALTPAVAGEPVETFAAQPHYGEAFWPDGETEEYTQPPTLDTAWFLTTEPKAAPDSLGIAITDTASVEAFEGVAVLIAALPTEPYSVDIYTPFVQTVEDWANLTTLDVSALTPDGTPPPPVGTPVRDPQAKLTGALAEAGLIDVEAKAVLTEEEGKAVLTETEGKAGLVITETDTQTYGGAGTYGSGSPYGP